LRASDAVFGKNNELQEEHDTVIWSLNNEYGHHTIFRACATGDFRKGLEMGVLYKLLADLQGKAGMNNFYKYTN
jgi:hypothetical protein